MPEPESIFARISAQQGTGVPIRSAPPKGGKGSPGGILLSGLVKVVSGTMDRAGEAHDAHELLDRLHVPRLGPQSVAMTLSARIEWYVQSDARHVTVSVPPKKPRVYKAQTNQYTMLEIMRAVPLQPGEQLLKQSGVWWLVTPSKKWALGRNVNSAKSTFHDLRESGQLKTVEVLGA
jgi:hypothetical protein